MQEDVFMKNTKELLSEEKWLLYQNEYLAGANQWFETLFTLTNGYMGTRGSYEEGARNEWSGNYLAGVFDKSDACNKELVNTPNWLGIKVYGTGNAFRFGEAANSLNLDENKATHFRRVLDMKKGILFRDTIFVDEQGRVTRVEGYRFISRGNIHRSGVKLYITPLNYNGIITIESLIDGSISNWSHNPKFRTKHFKIKETATLNGSGSYLEVSTCDNGTEIGIASDVRVYKTTDGENLDIINSRKFSTSGEQCIEFFEIKVKEKEAFELDKYVVTYTSRDNCNDIKSAAETDLYEYIQDGLPDELRKHIAEYERLWDIADISIDGNDKDDKALRFNIFHLMSSVNHNDKGVSIGAKALHGEGYWGHAYWDTEIFMLPFFIYTNPKAAKSLLTYRYNTLDGARENAIAKGYEGAKYPWQSADTGREEIPDYSFDNNGNRSKLWMGLIEDHVVADIAYGIHNYYKSTNDIDFMLKYGIEIFIETARFWASRCEFNQLYSRYEIHDVIGPDEFHEHVDNNSYTNYMALWNLNKAYDLVSEFKSSNLHMINELISKINLKNEELEKWRSIAKNLYYPICEETKIIEQFGGYFKKIDYIFDKFDENNMPYLEGEMELEKLSATRIIKQADTVMLIYLLGDHFNMEVKKNTYSYYEKRTWHKSSLSPCIYSLVGMKLGDYKKAYEYFVRTANVDLVDNQNNSGLGIHAAALGGTWQAAVFGFGGMTIDEEEIVCFNPWLPESWNEMKFKVYWKSSLLEVSVKKDDVTVKLLQSEDSNLKVKVRNRQLELKPIIT